MIVDSLEHRSVYQYIYGTYCTYPTQWFAEIYRNNMLVSMQINNLHTRKQVYRLNSWLHHLTIYDAMQYNVTLYLVNPNIRILDRYVVNNMKMDIEYIVSNMMPSNIQKDILQFRKTKKLIIL